MSSPPSSLSSSLSPSSPLTSLSVGSYPGALPELRVRFDEECVLIPEPISPSRMPRLVRKSYSLPLWKRKSPDSVLSSSPEMEDEHVVFTVSVPSFTTKSRSPTRSEALLQPLVPCIVDHASPKSPELRGRHARNPSSPPLSPRADIETVPLLPCCHECFHITDECLKEGEQWEEKFTRGARRLHNSSVDACPASHSHHRVAEAMPGFDDIVAVDEVDKKRLSHDLESHPALTKVDSLDLHRNDQLRLLPSLSREKSPPQIVGRSDMIPTPLQKVAEEDSDPLPLSKPTISTPSVSSQTCIVTPHTTDIGALYDTMVADSTSPHTEPSTPSTSSATPSVSHSAPLTTPDLHLSLIPSAPIPIPTSHHAHPHPHQRLSPHSPSLSRGSLPHSADLPVPHSLEYFASPHTPHTPRTPKRKRSLTHVLGPSSLLRVSAELLKGVNAVSGSPPLPV
ncbi:hypothetical protein BKA93DRAFT_822660 [Sparassis latifolia]|uniref:Uncharacterized protein n=1 Tax=Sparassis crispa TaxID=139825 RepID=A0A401GH25_9APHY|nr:hypothetical protein SCP_0312160 [Sparassis crispa]GBE81487.1 hypothetical protein SCP_0312160 [Sparassis crispa]